MKQKLLDRFRSSKEHIPEPTARNLGALAVHDGAAERISSTPLWRAVDVFSDPGYRNKMRLDTFNEAETQMPGFRDLRARLKRVSARLEHDFDRTLPPTEEERELVSEQIELKKSFYELGQEARFFDSKLEYLEAEKEVLVSNESDEAARLLALVWESPAVYDTESVKGEMSPKAIAERLKARFFEDTHEATQSVERTVTIESTNGAELHVPAELLIEVSGFNSWLGRGESGTDTISRDGSEAQTSFDLIVDYATRSTPLPPAGELVLYVQPNGKVFAGNGNGDSHRIAAALARGDATIRAKQLHFVPLTENIYE